MPYTIDDLITPETQDEVVDEILDIGTSLDLPVTSWQVGSIIRTMISTVSQKIADSTQTAVAITRGGLGDLLSDIAWAAMWAKQMFDVDIQDATPAITDSLTVTNSEPTTYVLAAGDLIVAHQTTGKTYRNTMPISITASVGITGVTIAADEPGTASNAAPGTITTVVTSLVGVGCTNLTSALGTDQETVAQLVPRARSSLGALSPDGPKEAYNYVAKTNKYSATSLPITRSTTQADPTTGIVSVYIANAAGAPSGGDVAIVQAAVDRNAEPWTVTSTVVAASNLIVPVTYQVWIRGSNLTSAQIQTAISAALAQYFSTLPIGGEVIPPAPGYVYVDSLKQIIGTATPGIVRVSVSAPAGDVAMFGFQVAVLGTVTGTVTVL